MKIEIEKVKISVKWWQLLIILVCLLVIALIFVWLMRDFDLKDYL